MMCSYSGGHVITVQTHVNWWHEAPFKGADGHKVDGDI